MLQSMGLHRVGHDSATELNLTEAALRKGPCVHLVTQSCPTRLLCPRNSPGKNTGVGCHFLLPRDLPNPGIEPVTLHLQVDSLPLRYPESPEESKTQEYSVPSLPRQSFPPILKLTACLA